jgi:hypothetical protein
LHLENKPQRGAGMGLASGFMTGSKDASFGRRGQAPSEMSGDFDGLRAGAGKKMKGGALDEGMFGGGKNSLMGIDASGPGSFLLG